MPESFTPHLRTGLSLLLGRASRSHCICGGASLASLMLSHVQLLGREDVTKGGM